jgi:hypothetical protein
MLAVRALAVGWAFYLLSAFPVTWAFQIVHTWVRDWLGPLGTWGAFVADHATFDVLVSVVCLLAGWAIARLHSDHAIPMVCLYAASVLAFEVGVPGYILLSHPPPPHMWAAPNLLVLPVVLSLSHPVSILLGGLWGARSDEITARLSRNSN